MSELFNILNSINDKKTLYDPDSVESDYNPYIINRGLGYYYDTVLFANEMNMYAGTPKYYQYLFYYYGVDKKKRWSKWHKKTAVDNLELIKEYFGYSTEKAEEALNILSDEEIEKIKDLMYTGGRAKR